MNVQRSQRFVHNGMVFADSKQLKSGQLTWRCRNRRKGCKGMVYTLDSRVVRVAGDHNHPRVSEPLSEQQVEHVPQEHSDQPAEQRSEQQQRSEQMAEQRSKQLSEQPPEQRSEQLPEQRSKRRSDQQYEKPSVKQVPQVPEVPAQSEMMAILQNIQQEQQNIQQEQQNIQQVAQNILQEQQIVRREQRKQQREIAENHFEMVKELEANLYRKLGMIYDHTSFIISTQEDDDEDGEAEEETYNTHGWGH